MVGRIGPTAHLAPRNPGLATLATRRRLPEAARLAHGGTRATPVTGGVLGKAESVPRLPVLRIRLDSLALGGEESLGVLGHDASRRRPREVVDGNVAFAGLVGAHRLHGVAEGDLAPHHPGTHDGEGKDRKAE